MRFLSKIDFSLQGFFFEKFFLFFFIFFLPFSQALTFDIDFPLKISEISIAFLCLIFIKNIFYKKFHFLPHPFINQFRLVFSLLILFLSIAIASYVINILYEYPYFTNITLFRYGINIDSFLKTIYVFIAFFALYFSLRAFLFNLVFFSNVIFVGALLSGIYGWYLFISSINDYTYYLLPGMDSWPQHGLYSFGHFIRCGTFKEGNYAGLFFILTGIIALDLNRIYIAALLFLCILPTVSSMALVGVSLLLTVYFVYHCVKVKRYKLLTIAFGLFFCIIILLSGNKDFSFVVAKFVNNDDVEFKDAKNSREERLNLSKIAFRIGLDNPFLGVGLSNFSAHVHHYNSSPIYNTDKNFKYIPNNAYLEIFSELGLLALLIFVTFLLFLIRLTIEFSFLLALGLMVMLFYLIAFPTFTVLYLWFFLGYVLSRYYLTKTHAFR
jgi:O-antigen ligase